MGSGTAVGGTKTKQNKPENLVECRMPWNNATGFLVYINSFAIPLSLWYTQHTLHSYHHSSLLGPQLTGYSPAHWLCPSSLVILQLTGIPQLTGYSPAHWLCPSSMVILQLNGYAPAQWLFSSSMVMPQLNGYSPAQWLCSSSLVMPQLTSNSPADSDWLILIQL